MAGIKKLDRFIVEHFLEHFDFASVEYRDCMNIMQELLELPASIGVPLARQGDPTDRMGYLQDFSERVVEKMIEQGYDDTLAWRCRNSAAAKAFKVPLKNNPIEDALFAGKTKIQCNGPAVEV